MGNKGRLLAAALLAVGFARAVIACEGTHSAELKSIKAADDRDWATFPSGHAFMSLVNAETARNRRIGEIQQANGLCTFEDYLSAGSVRAHGFAMWDKLEAVKLASVAQSLDPSSKEAKAIFARAMDEIVFKAQGKQLYGTLKDQTDGKETVLPIMQGAVPESEKKLVLSVPYKGIN